MSAASGLNIFASPDLNMPVEPDLRVSTQPNLSVSTQPDLKMSNPPSPNMSAPPHRLNLQGLPAEIRNKIWTDVLGDRMIVIDTCGHVGMPYHPRHPFIIAVIDLPPKSPHDTSFVLATPDANQLLLEFRTYCRDSRSDIQDFSLSLLLVNRQIYQEAKSIFDLSNLFTLTTQCNLVDFPFGFPNTPRSYFKANALAPSGYVFNNSGTWGARLHVLDTIHLHVNLHVDCNTANPSVTLQKGLNTMIDDLGAIRRFVGLKGWRVRRIPIFLKIVVLNELEGLDTWLIQQAEVFLHVAAETRDEVLQYVIQEFGEDREEARVELSTMVMDWE